MPKMTMSEAGKLGSEKSRETQQKIYTDRVSRYLESPKLCEKCGSVLKYSKRYNSFCSQSCAASHNNLGVRRHGEEKENTQCLQCGNDLSGSADKYCSSVCMAIYRFENNLTKKSPNSLRYYLLAKRGHQCEICKNTSWLNQPIALEVDHVDGDSNNNGIENIRLICPNCHAMTPNYKNRNKGHGRVGRREIYQRGKTV